METLGKMEMRSTENVHTTTGLRIKQTIKLSANPTQKSLTATMSTANALTTCMSVLNATSRTYLTLRVIVFHWPRPIARISPTEFASNAHKATISTSNLIALSCQQTAQELTKWVCASSVKCHLFWWSQASVCLRSWTVPNIQLMECANNAKMAFMSPAQDSARRYLKTAFRLTWQASVSDANKATPFRKEAAKKLFQTVWRPTKTVSAHNAWKASTLLHKKCAKNSQQTALLPILKENAHNARKDSLFQMANAQFNRDKIKTAQNKIKQENVFHAETFMNL